MPVLGVIPARLGSTRLPRKPLQSLAGVPLVIRVAERVRSLGCVDDLVVATDSAEVAAVAKQAGVECVLTSSAHETGTERVAEVAARPEFAGFDLIVNVQGDEPFVPRSAKEPGAGGVPGVPARREFAAFPLIVNVRGGEPFVPRDAVAGAILRV